MFPDYGWSEFVATRKAIIFTFGPNSSDDNAVTNFETVSGDEECVIVVRVWGLALL